ncbi:MAG: AMP-dependent synthetase/ligase [Desulfomonilia bacterium]
MSYRTDTLCGMFHNQAIRLGEAHPFLVAKFDDAGKPTDGYHTITWKKARDQVFSLAQGLVTLGLEPHHTVIIFSESRPRWIIADQAIQACGAVCVPLYPTLSRSELTYMIKDSEARIVIASTQLKASEVLKLRENHHDLKDLVVITMGPWEGSRPDMVYTFTDVMGIGQERVNREHIEESIQRVIPSDIASIIYTSGTTGTPKGVILTQSNFVTNVLQCASSELMMRQKSRDLRLVCLVHLPLCHSYGRTSDYHVGGLYLGGVLAFAESLDTIARDLREIRPNIINSIPRFFEKTYDAIQSNISRQKYAYRTLFFWALKKGQLYADAMASGKRLSHIHLNQFGLANMLVFDRIKRIIGMDRLVFATAGGGKLSKEVCAFFRSMNIQLSEGYGLTETSPVLNFNAPEILENSPSGKVQGWLYDLIMETTVDLMVVRQSQGFSPYGNLITAAKLGVCYSLLLYKLRVKPGTVGRPVVWTHEKIASDGEILVKGPQIFSGYWKMPDETKNSFTEDGWFKTGDIGVFDEEGFLMITDRKKDLIVTSGGKNVAPHPIEVSLVSRPYIDQVCLVGDGRKYLTALIVPDFGELARYARTRAIEYKTEKDLVHTSEIQELIQAEVNRVNDALPRYEQIKYFTLMDEPFSEQTGELTPTLKIKRKVVQEKYRNLIEQMYQV